MSKIIQLTAEHVKRLNVVEITPKGDVIVIGGKNGQGKSSVLDSIVYALGGDPKDPMPVHRGEAKAKVVVDLGDIVVQRTITAEGGGQLVVKNKDGVRQTSPQQLLDGLIGKLTFDPLDFARQKPAKQAEILRGIVGLDFTKHDQERQKLFDKRTDVNRDVRHYEARVKTMPSHGDAPAAEQSAAEVLQKQREASELNQRNAAIRADAKRLRGIADSAKSVAETGDEEIAELERKLEQKRKHVAGQHGYAKTTAAEAAAAESHVSNLTDHDLSPFEKQLTDIELGNLKFRENAQRAQVVAQFKTKTAEAEGLTNQIEALDSKKRKILTEAKYPIDGLQFDAAGGVLLAGIPFEQCSSAEQLRVSVAIGLALNPKLRVLLIRDGSLLDEDSMKLLVEMAAKAQAQIWLERVGVDANTSVVIEDGSATEAK